MEKCPTIKHFVVSPTRSGVQGMKYAREAIPKYWEAAGATPGAPSSGTAVQPRRHRQAAFAAA